MVMFTSHKIVKPDSMVLFGPFSEKGISLKLYSYKTAHRSNISDYFQNGSLVILLNISGHGNLLYNYDLTINPQQVVLQIKKNTIFSMQREANQVHRFLILEIAQTWLASLMKEYPYATKKEITLFINGNIEKTTPLLSPFCSNLRSLGEEFLLVHSKKDRPSLWFYAKILEIFSHTLFEEKENFCSHRKDLVALERIESVKKSLSSNLANAPSLAQCAKTAGCSKAYLSRIFSQYTGLTMSHYLRNLRLEHAAVLLKSGKYNVTEAAMEVGYSSLSHFSKAFSKRFHVCPCSFGLHGNHPA